MDRNYFIQKLSLKNPSFLKEYSYILLPESFKATDKIKIDCLIHGVFYQKAYCHLFGQGCPICGQQKCANSRALTTSDFVLKSQSKFGSKFDYTKTKYFRKDVNVVLNCPVHGDFELTPDNHLWSKFGCLKCDYEIPRQISKNKYLEKAKRIHNDKYDYSKVEYKNSTEPVEIICPVHGSFWQGMYQHVAKESNCPKCSKDLEKNTLQVFLTKSKKIHGDYYDYSKVDYKTNLSLVIITCRKHGDFIQRAGSHLLGCGCRKCFIEKTRGTTEKFIKEAKKIHGDYYDYSKVNYIGNKKAVEIICPVHGSFWQKPNSHISSKSGCRFCCESIGEKSIKIFLDKYGIKYIREYRILPHLYRYDFYLPDFNVFIEFNGIQHYKPIDYFGGVQAFLEVKERDSFKKLLVDKNNGKLLILTYVCSNNESVEKEMIIKLKKLYIRWYLIDGKLKVFKTLNEIYNYFSIPSSVLTRNIDFEVSKKVESFKILF